MQMEKVKRRKSFRRKRSPWKIILLILGCVVLVVGGFFAASMIDNYINYKNSQPSDASSSSPSSQPTSDPASQPGGDVSSPASNPGQTTLKGTRAVTVPAQSLSSRVTELLALAKDGKINAVVVDIKTEDGTLQYATKLEAATKAGAIKTGAPDLSSALKQLEEGGVKTIARMSCFKDPKAAMKISGAAVMYRPNPSLIWLDSAKNGKAWLNPYADAAKTYLIDIAAEAADMGFAEILLANVQFPDNNSSAGYYGSAASGVSQSQALTEFVTQMRGAMERKDVEVRLQSGALAAAGGTNTIYGGVNPVTLGGENMVVDLRVGTLGKNLAIGDNPIADPAADPVTTVENLAEAMKDAGVQPTCILDADSADLSGQIAVLSTIGFEDFILYRESGSYTASDLTA